MPGTSESIGAWDMKLLPNLWFVTPRRIFSRSANDRER